MVLGLWQRQARVQAFPVHGHDAQRLVTLIGQTPSTDGLYYTTDQHAYGVLSIHGDVIGVRSAPTPAVERKPMNEIERFWDYLTDWLARYRGVPSTCSHLYLGEISFRFHHKDRDLVPLVLDCLKHTAVHEVDGM